jgi:hypothetical protein
MKTILALLLAACGIAQAQINFTFTNLEGRVYSNTTVTSTNAESIVVSWDTGLSRIYFTNLPESVQKRFHYDSANAAAFTAEKEAHNKLLSGNMSKYVADARIRREFNDQKARILSTERQVSAEVFQIVKDGVLVHLLVQGLYQPGTLAMLWQYPSAGLVDGQKLRLKFYSIGTYQYETVNGSSKTILRITASLEKALQMDFYDKHPDWPSGQEQRGLTPEQTQELQRQLKLEARLRGIDYFPITNDAPIDIPPSSAGGRGER